MDDLELEISPDPSDEERRAIVAALERSREGEPPLLPLDPHDTDE